MIVEKVACGPPLPRLPRHPFHGSPEWKPSGIPVAVVCDHGAVVSTSFPSPDAGWGPSAPTKFALDRMPPMGGDRSRTRVTIKHWELPGVLLVGILAGCETVG